MSGEVSVIPFDTKAAKLKGEGFEEGTSPLGDYSIASVARDLSCVACGAPEPAARVFRRDGGEAPDNKRVFTVCGFCGAWEQHGPAEEERL